MFSPTSRYQPYEKKTYTAADGREISYMRRRFLPNGEDLPLLLEATLTDGDRLDQLAARMIGDPEQFWRIADANNAMNPFDLADEAGKKLRVPIPQIEQPR